MVWEFEERVEESLRIIALGLGRSLVSSFIQLKLTRLVEIELRKSSGDTTNGSEKLFLTGK